MTKKVVDKDSYPYRDDNSTPDAEERTAYHDKKELEGADLVDDRNGNSSTFFKGGASAKKDTTRKAADQDTTRKAADQTTSKITKVLEDRFGSMSESGHMKRLGRSKSHKNLYRKSRKYEEEIQFDNDLVEVSGVQREREVTRTGDLPLQQLRRLASNLKGNRTGHHMKTLNVHGKTRGTNPRYYSESENPGVATSPVTSDNPMLGMYATNTSSSNNSRFNIKTILEAIAIQAAETFEALDVNSNIPETFASELDQCSKALDRLHSHVTNNSNNNLPGNPVPAESPTVPLRKEEYEEMDEGFMDTAKNLASKAGKTIKTFAKNAVHNVKTQVPQNFERRTDQDLPITRLFKKPSDGSSMEEQLSKKQSDELDISPKDGKITASDLAAKRAQSKLAEASIGIFKHLVERNKNANN
jgi:hypothetical protein